MPAWLTIGVPIASAVFAGLTLLMRYRARRPKVHLRWEAASRGSNSVRVDLTAQNVGEVPCSVRRLEVLLDGSPPATLILSLGGAEPLTLPVPILVGHPVTLSVGLQPPDVELSSTAPPLLGRHLKARVWLTGHRKVDLDVVGAPVGTRVITRVLNRDGTVAHDCAEAGCSTSWDGRDLLTGQQAPGAGPLPPLDWVDDNTVRLRDADGVAAGTKSPT